MIAKRTLNLQHASHSPLTDNSGLILHYIAGQWFCGHERVGAKAPACYTQVQGLAAVDIGLPRGPECGCYILDTVCYRQRACLSQGPGSGLPKVSLHNIYIQLRLKFNLFELPFVAGWTMCYTPTLWSSLCWRCSPRIVPIPHVARVSPAWASLWAATLSGFTLSSTIRTFGSIPFWRFSSCLSVLSSLWLCSDSPLPSICWANSWTMSCGPRRWNFRSASSSRLFGLSLALPVCVSLSL